MSSSNPESGDFSPTDRSLLQLVRGGDEDAATELYERYARRVFGLVESKLGALLRASTEPEDVVQSVFKSMFRGVQAGHYDAPPGTTLWNLLAVIAVHKLRRRAKRITAKRRDAKRNVPLDNVEQAIPVDASSLDFLKITLRETIETLRPQDQEILSLRIEGFKVEEISNQTGRSCRTVERSLQRSREQLAELLLGEE